MSNKKVIVIGAGIVGLSTAYFLRQKGIAVTVIDNTDGTDNCSYGNAGYVSPSHIIPLASPGIINQGLKWMLNPESPFYIKPRINRDLIRWGWLFKKAATQQRVEAGAAVLNALTVESKKLYEEIMQEESIDAGYQSPGLLMVCKTRSALHHETELVKMAKGFGLKAEIISKEAVEKLDPNVQYHTAGAAYFESDGWMTPHLFMQEFRQRLISAGVEIRYNTALKEIIHHGAKIEKLLTSTGELTADDYVLSAGAWTPQLMKQLKIDIPLQAGKGYSFVLPKPPVMPKLPSILVEGSIATTPMVHGLRFAGTMEIAGTQLNLNQRRIQGIIKGVQAFMPQFTDAHFTEIKPWAGLRPCTPDGLPYIGRTQRYSNLLVGTGHAMLGWTLGPVTGQILATEIAGDKHSIQSPLLAVERYA